MKQTLILESKHQRNFLAGVYHAVSPMGIVVFAHGFKGFKDWGTFPAVAEHFAAQGFTFVSFNFSHNGTTIEKPDEFADLEAFGNNNFSIELDDLGVVLDAVFEQLNAADLPVHLLGHSRGGGICILKAKEDERVHKVAVWGSVNQFGKFWKHNELERMKNDGVIYIPNARTGQQMPVYKQLYENYEANLQRLFIPDAVKGMKQPLLIVHGSKDETIPVEAALEMHQWNASSVLKIIEDANHTFGGKHPYREASLPMHTIEAINATLVFFE